MLCGLSPAASEQQALSNHVLCHAGLRGRRCATACNVECIASKGTWTARLLWAPVENSETGTCK